MKGMKTWQKVVLVNASALAGVAISLFIVPGNTRIWLWGMIAIAVVALTNWMMFRKGATAAREGRTGIPAWVVIVIGLGVLLLDLLFGRS